MATNGIEMALEMRLDEEALRIGKPTLDPAPEAAHPRSAAAPETAETSGSFALAPLVDKIAYGIAKGLVVAMKELENHIASETRKVGDAVDRRLEALQASLQDLYGFAGEQRTVNAAFDARVQELTAGLREIDVRQTAEVAAARQETQQLAASVSERFETTAAALRAADARQSANLASLDERTNALAQSVAERIGGLSKELGVQQEDLAAVKATLGAFSSRVEALVERLDRQADAVRSMYAAYSQRETELEQLVDGLARLRAFPTPLPSNGL